MASTISQDEVKRRLDQYNKIVKPSEPIPDEPQVDKKRPKEDPAKYSTGTKIVMLMDFSDLAFEPDNAMTDQKKRENYNIVAKIKSRVLKSPILEGQGTVYQLDFVGLEPWPENADPGPGFERIFSSGNEKTCPNFTKNICPFDRVKQRPLRFWLTVDDDGTRASVIVTDTLIDLQQLHDDLTNDVNPSIIFAEFPVAKMISIERPSIVQQLPGKTRPRIQFRAD